MTILIETTPKMDLAIQDIEHLVRSCAPSMPSTALCCSGVNNGKRRTPLSRVAGDIARKSIEPMVLAVDGSPPRRYGPCSPLSVKDVAR